MVVPGNKTVPTANYPVIAHATGRLEIRAATICSPARATDTHTPHCCCERPWPFVALI